MSAVQSDIALNRLHVRCMITGEHIFTGDIAGERSAWDTETGRNRFMNTPRNNNRSFQDATEVAQEEK